MLSKKNQSSLMGQEAMTQNAKLLSYLERNPNGITQLESFNTLGICRLSERVRELERLGYLIAHTREKTSGGAYVTRYKLLHLEQNMIYSSQVNDPTTWDATPMVGV